MNTRRITEKKNDKSELDRILNNIDASSIMHFIH